MSNIIQKTFLWKRTPLAGAVAVGLTSAIILTLAGKAWIGAAEPSASAFVMLRRTLALAAGAGGCAMVIGAVSALCFLQLERLRLRQSLAARHRLMLLGHSDGGR